MFKQFCLEGILAKESLVTTKGCHAESDFQIITTWQLYSIFCVSAQVKTNYIVIR